MYLRSVTTALIGTLATLAACAKQVPEPTGPRIAIDIAPLTLPGTTGVEYAIAVFNESPTNPMFDADGEVISPANDARLVWQQASVTSTRFGNGDGGDITYIGPCDASVAENWVAIVLRNIEVDSNNGSFDGTGEFAGTRNLLDDQNSAFSTAPGSNDGDPDFQNPCDFNSPCVRKFRCAPNEDTEVVFNLTVMRDARQGFFDVAVDFQDVFCSMKVDTCYEGTEPIELLFDDEGHRVETVVIAAACSAGVKDTNTVMWMAPLTVTCDGGVTISLDPTGDHDADPTTPGREGNQSIDAIADGEVTTVGVRSAGTLTFTLETTPSTPTTIAIPAGTLVTRVDNGLDYLTTTAVSIDTASSSSVQVTAEAMADGVEYDSATGFATISRAGADGAFHTLNVSGSGFTGGLDPVVEGGIQIELGYATYWGDEDLTCSPDGASCNKAYWNVAVNVRDLMDAGFTNCRVSTAITASGSPALDQFVNGGLAGPGQTYGYVDIDAQLMFGARLACFEGPMGSEYASAEYGASVDMVGSNPFPNLCYYFERGSVAPRSLGETDNYFTDPDSNADDATYGGRIPLGDAPPLRLVFPQMGGDSTGPCQSRVLNRVAAVYFDGASSLQEFTWRGIGGTGEYQIDVYTKAGLAGWELWGGYTVDLRTDLGRVFFAAGGKFPNAGDSAVALVVTRLDDPVVTVDDIVIEVGP